MWSEGSLDILKNNWFTMFLGKKIFMSRRSTLFNSKNLGGNIKFHSILDRNKCLINVKMLPLLYLEILTGRSKYFFLNNFISFFTI